MRRILELGLNSGSGGPDIAEGALLTLDSYSSALSKAVGARVVVFSMDEEPAMPSLSRNTGGGLAIAACIVRIVFSSYSVLIFWRSARFFASLAFNLGLVSSCTFIASAAVHTIGSIALVIADETYLHSNLSV